MKANKSLLFTLLLSIPFLFGSCSDKDDETQGGAKDTEDQSINEWIYDEMSEKYFWNDQLAPKNNLNFNDKPDQFFYKTLSKQDRFSAIYYDGIYQTKEYASAKPNSRAIHNEIGFEYQAFLDNKGVIDFLVTYVKKDTEANKQGLKRGDRIITVDGASMNDGNWRAMLHTGKASYKLTFENREPLTLNATPTHNENPIHTYKILPNTRIGYILYNAFANGKNDNSYEYAIEMNNEVLKSFEGKIDELILDLRYNNGGLVQSGTYIASAIANNIAPNRSSKVYTKRNYNSILEKIPAYHNNKNNYFYDEITVGRTRYAIPQLNYLKRIYVITSEQTASASEQIINGLRAYMTVEVIGETTIGKNMESFPIQGKDEAEKWELHPLSSVSYRSNLEAKNNDYSKGFPPTIGWQGINGKGVSGFHYENDEFQTLREEGKFYDLGDPNETLLAKAIEHITGKTKRMKRSLAVPTSTTEMRSLGSSLDRKAKLMIIENQEVKQE